MLKHILILLIYFPFAAKACAATGDTTLLYFKYPRQGVPTAAGKDKSVVGDKDNFDYLQMIFPPDPVTHFSNLKEFYKNGTLKFAAQLKIAYQDGKPTRHGQLQGNAICFYPNGKRQSIFTYLDGYIVGAYYEYYPEGKLYNIRVYPASYHAVHHDLKDCYDRDGTQICKDGEGKWVFYDDNFKNIALEGPVKNGVMQGVWHGRTYVFADTVEYNIVYKQGYAISGKSYDKAGNVYPFINSMDSPVIQGNRIDFIDVFERHLILPKNIDVSKGSLDTLRFSFVLEKDGSISHIQPIGQADPQITIAVAEALKQCPKWTPRKYYGLPMLSQIVFPLLKPKGQGQLGYPYYREYIQVPKYDNYPADLFGFR